MLTQNVVQERHIYQRSCNTKEVQIQERYSDKLTDDRKSYSQSICLSTFSLQDIPKLNHKSALPSLNYSLE